MHTLNKAGKNTVDIHLSWQILSYKLISVTAVNRSRHKMKNMKILESHRSTTGLNSTKTV